MLVYFHRRSRHPLTGALRVQDRVRNAAEGAVSVRAPGHEPSVVREHQAVVVATGYGDNVLVVAKVIVSRRCITDGPDSVVDPQAQLSLVVDPHDEDVHGLRGRPVDDLDIW